MKANENLSPMDLERLTKGSVWKDESGAQGYVISLANTNVPKQVRDQFPLTVLFTRDFESILTVKAADFVRRMTFVSASKETEGYVKSMLLALKSHSELGDVVDTGLTPQVDLAIVSAQASAATDAAESAAVAQEVLEAPVEILFNDSIHPDIANAINGAVVSFVEKPVDRVLEIMFDASVKGQLDRALDNVIHVDTEDRVYSGGDALVLVDLTQAHVRGATGFASYIMATLAMPGDEDDEDDEGAGADTEALRAAMDAAGVPVVDTTNVPPGPGNVTETQPQ